MLRDQILLLFCGVGEGVGDGGRKVTFLKQGHVCIAVALRTLFPIEFISVQNVVDLLGFAHFGEIHTQIFEHAHFCFIVLFSFSYMH